MHNADDWITQLQLEPHPEGGFFRQTMKSDEAVTTADGRNRAQYTSIHFLVRSGEPSRLHRLESDEMWYYHTGAPLDVHMIHPESGHREIMTLGPNAANGEVLQGVVPKGTIFGAEVRTSEQFALVSCVVVPGFDFADFELLTRDELTAAYPEHREVIERLT
ncbi:cupin domain-containing protein [Marinococcus sp. PL1-022]|uniref:cupin domain-containing protein n=1 Tax=Marinococcus sp. PL1-022 TaxID=3095363 RepID=UPI0029C53032|nr:cupin domain-containing protein [Marinococcus sp. PL1-022]MDX6153959.1 cupin domain-containing protein [Marinococcus sp. PL1-022]